MASGNGTQHRWLNSAAQVGHRHVWPRAEHCKGSSSAIRSYRLCKLLAAIACYAHAAAGTASPRSLNWCVFGAQRSAREALWPSGSAATGRPQAFGMVAGADGANARASRSMSGVGTMVRKTFSPEVRWWLDGRLADGRYIKTHPEERQAAEIKEWPRSVPKSMPYCGCGTDSQITGTANRFHAYSRSRPPIANPGRAAIIRKSWIGFAPG